MGEMTRLQRACAVSPDTANRCRGDYDVERWRRVSHLLASALGVSVARPSVGSNNVIWVFAGLYFACYVPFSGLTKALSKGAYPGMDAPLSGATILPIATAASLVVMLIFISVMGWWRYAGTRRIAGRNIPFPGKWTALSGLCTAMILTTTTMAYAIDGVSIVFMMLLMRGGVLIIAPVIDSWTGRATRWYSWVGLALSMGALVVAFSDDSSYDLTVVAVVDLFFYLASYAIRLRLMSHRAKSEDTDQTLRYFVEEQLVTAPAALLMLAILALIGEGAFLQEIRAGFTTHIHSGLVLETIIIGVFSQGAGIFGTLVFLDKRENTYSVPVNRASSILAGVTATVVLSLWLGLPSPGTAELVAVGLVVTAILVLGLAPTMERRRAAKKAS